MSSFIKTSLINFLCRGRSITTTFNDSNSGNAFEDDYITDYVPELEDADINDTFTYILDSPTSEGTVIWLDNATGRYQFSTDNDFQDLVYCATRDVSFDYYNLNQNLCTKLIPDLFKIGPPKFISSLVVNPALG